MKKLFGMLAVAALLAACADEEAIEGDGGTGGGGITTARGDVTNLGGLESFAYNSQAGTLIVSIPLDASSASASYQQAGTLRGYDKFTQQDDPLDRAFTAFAKTSSDGSVSAVAVTDGGQFGASYGGATTTLNGTISRPTNGLVSYAGDYVGLINNGPAGTVPAGTDPSLVPYQATPVTGTVFLNADFNGGGALNGSIYNRAYGVNGTGTALDDVILSPTDIGSEGTFSGTATGGTYSGVFGGTDAAAIAGGVTLATPAGVEFGIFVLDQCAVGAGGICGQVNPN